MFSWIKKLFKSDKVEAPKSVSLGQFMITKKMRAELRDLGYSKFQIDKLTPTEAAIRIENSHGPHW